MALTSRQDSSIRTRALHVAPPSPLPSRLGSWELVQRIGGGALADIYAARTAGSHVDQAPSYALKVLREEWQADPRGLAILAREVQVARRVAHPRIVPILAAELESPPFYLAMPLLEGCSLALQLEQGPRLDLPVVCWIARQAAEGLAALESRHWMHGDVKPSNLMVSPSGHVTLIDFGCASETTTRASIAERPLLGTISYMAPELLFSSSGGDALSDVYSLGVMLFESLTGRLPFDTEDVAELALQHRQQLPSDVRCYMPQIPLRAARLVQQMLSKEPMRRPTPGELVQRLISLEIETFAERFSCEAA
jgi:serine/threonine protein kinase